MPPPARPIVRALRAEESRALLERSHVGRIAFSLHDRVDVEPIHYVFSDPWIFGRTSQGARLLSPAPHRDIIFGIHASEISGRCSTSSAADSAAPAVSSVMGPT